MKKAIALIVVVPPLLFTIVFGYILVKGPRMTVQHHFREFQTVLPPPPAGTVAAQADSYRIPAGSALAQLKNPLQGTPANLERGGVYYSYYCIFCHGESGAGDGPVGHSYIPVPADLRRATVAGYSDGELLRAMLTGVGHEPVLERVVPTEQRPYLALFVRSLAVAR
ncbi:cytochrome C [Geoanaerobacter pelophilus]|uniref:Cytochrome C n=1 Tax=Geoanaerobacter pelophilus TaxID=60036 RepID=A0ABQ0MMA5_9BACT|nr:cytochrome C [Geoanaerobacter pelophilus]GAW68210.1 cytochrome C [Geoanaerobacter pelophilus]